MNDIIAGRKFFFTGVRLLFNSWEYIFIFLPLSLTIYFSLNRMKFFAAAKGWLALSSLFFYSWWSVKYLPLIAASIVFNFFAGALILRQRKNERLRQAKYLLAAAIAADLALLGYFKYTDFFITNINSITGTHIELAHIILPLGISFYTFTQIAYLVDAYRNKASEYDFINYTLFVSFFPHLLAGPILHHSEMMPQFDDRSNKTVNSRNLSMGIFLFFIGLFKKAAIADEFAVWANYGFDAATHLTFIEAWATSLAYTFQIYFDFSGYTDMALGAALMFNICLPINFNSPYKASSVQDFWRRWHITLSRFLRDYVYIPLGGNREGDFRTCNNLLVTFLIGGLWHGAGWMFVLWGLLHGAALVAHRLWQKAGLRMHRLLAWALTFAFVDITWVFFRAKDWADASKVLSGMFNPTDLALPAQVLDTMPSLKRFFAVADTLRFVPDNTVFGNAEAALFTLFIFAVTVFFSNTTQLSYRKMFVLFVVTLAFSIQSVLFSQVPSEFIYFRF